jgi:RES domain-containing protein
LTLTAWRIVQTQHAERALSGEGARLYGGRWNHKGTPLVYTASSLALAALELLVHLEIAQILEAYVGIAVEFAEEQCHTLAPSRLPADWASFPAPNATREIGTQWARQGHSAVLAVPSVLVPVEMNFLFNPQHPDFVKLKVGKPTAFHFDPRLMKNPK